MTRITPARACDGKLYVDAKGSNNFSVYHLDFERERGNLHEVEYVRDVHSEEEIGPDDLIDFGGMTVRAYCFVAA